MGLKEIVLGIFSSSGEPIARTVQADPMLPSGSPLANVVREAVQIELAARKEIRQRDAETQAQIVNQRAETERERRAEQGRKIAESQSELQETFSKFKIMELMRDLRDNVWKGGDLSPEPIFAPAYEEHYYLPGSETGRELFARLSIMYRGTIIDPDPPRRISADGEYRTFVSYGPGECIAGLDVGVRAFDESRSLFVRTISHPRTAMPSSISSLKPLIRGEFHHGYELHKEFLTKIPLSGEEDPDSIFNQLSGIVGEDAKSRYLRGGLPPGKLVARGEQEIEEFGRRMKETHNRGRFPPGYGIGFG